MTDVPGDVRTIFELLGELGYTATQQGDNSLEVQSNKVTATIMVYAGGSLSLRCGVEGGGAHFRLEDVNLANHELRFGKFSVEGDRLFLESDFVFDPGDEGKRQNLEKIMHIWDTSLTKLKELVERSMQPT